jgi:hypothetical protein
MRVLTLLLVASVASAQPHPSRMADVFTHGGKLFTPVVDTSARRCVAMRVTTTDFVYTDWDGTYMTTTSWAYSWSPEEPDTVGIADPTTHTEVVPPNPDVWPPGSYGTLCADNYKITVARDHVEIGGQLLYFTLAGCRVAMNKAIGRNVVDFLGDC